MSKNRARPFRGVIIEESLEDKSILGELKIVETEVENVTDYDKTPWLSRWMKHTVEVPEERARSVAERLAKAIVHRHKRSWYADFKNERFHYIIFRDKVFKVNRGSEEEYDELSRFGEALGIPESRRRFKMPPLAEPE